MKLKVKELPVTRTRRRGEDGKKEVKEYPIEQVSMGEFSVDLKVGEIEVESKEFGDYLVRKYAFEPVGEEPKADEAEPDAEESNDLESDYPEDFPKREIFIGLGIAFDTLKNLTKKQLVELDDVGPKTAADVIEYFGGGE